MENREFLEQIQQYAVRIGNWQNRKIVCFLMKQRVV